MKTLYDLFKIREDAPPEIIKVAYKALSSMFHLNKKPGDEAAAEMMKKVNKAHAILRYPESRALYAVLFLLSTSPAFAGNFAECILDRLPGGMNQATHSAVFQTCSKSYPDRYFEIRKGSGRGVFGFSDGNACTIKKAKDTLYGVSSMQIAFACRCLYDSPSYNGEMCENKPVNWNDYTPIK